MPQEISALQALIMGIVEGLTEYLPVSSTGHLILTARLMGLSEESDGIKAFQVVIQAGAVLAVLGIYLRSVGRMVLGLAGRNPAGRTLFQQLLLAFLPAAVVGLLANELIKDILFGAEPVVIALAVGGAVMIVVERRRVRPLIGQGHEARARAGRPLAEMTLRAALLIGLAQCLALWPGTSRSMVTIVAALLLGFSPRAAAEFSFLLALPTLGAATAYDFLDERRALVAVAGWDGLAIGFAASFAVAWLAVKGFLAWLGRHGLEPFGWYRIALAGLFALIMLEAG